MSQYSTADWQIKDAGGGNITAYNPITLEKFSGTIAQLNAKVKLVPPGGAQLVRAAVNTSGNTELIGEDNQVISAVGGGAGIAPDATGTLAGRATYNTSAVGFVYLATDQNPAQYFFREGASGNWSPAVIVQGLTGTTGPQGVQGIQGVAGNTGAQGPAGADGVTFVAGATDPNDADGRANGTVYVKY